MWKVFGSLILFLGASSISLADSYSLEIPFLYDYQNSSINKQSVRTEINAANEILSQCDISLSATEITALSFLEESYHGSRKVNLVFNLDKVESDDWKRLGGVSEIPSNFSNPCANGELSVRDLAMNGSGIVLAHEILHSLGLNHSNDSSNVMYPRAVGRQLNAEQCQRAQLAFPRGGILRCER